jgi:soluble lytic murein transglycosylase-like protein
MQAPPPPDPALAEAVRAGRWAEVRTLTNRGGQPLPPLLALVTARAARTLGEPARALEFVRAVLPRAGELGAALRLEGAEAAIALAQDPLPFLAPLLSSSSPVAHRKAAAARLRAAFATLPLPTLRAMPRPMLPLALRREFAVALAVRGEDEAGALHVLAERVNDKATLRVAQWLAGRTTLPPSTRLAVAEALLAGGAWREAEQVVMAMEPPPGPGMRFRWEFVRGRAAYRLGELARAAGAFEQALTIANSDMERFTAAVQRGRLAELSGDLPAALPLFDLARAAQPREVEGWDGGLRMRVLLNRKGEALDLLKGCPAKVLRVAGPRLAATLLLRGDPVRARATLARLPKRLPVVRALAVALFVRTGEVEAARAEAASLLADRSAGPWREQALALLPADIGDALPPPPTRDIRTLASIATRLGAEQARTALATALAADPAWTSVLAGRYPEPAGWTGAAHDLAAVGLEREAAAVYPHTFPSGSPAEQAWSARTLALWDNRPSALGAGERLWANLGAVPAVLLPEKLLPAILPPELVAGCVAAANEEAVPPSWLCAIIRQESRFEVEAYSVAGAIGVAQLMPEVARRLGATPDQLTDENLALRLAAREVAGLKGRFGPRLAPVAAAYNAGETVVAGWLAEFGAEPDEMLLIAATPYRETATYTLAVREGAELARFLNQPPGNE